ncbi:hypothetical protein GW17_00033930 [Ensete ventricosum]|nr:hypothetical protein GW17_00033930 [Ensete ventricosum]
MHCTVRCGPPPPLCAPLRLLSGSRPSPILYPRCRSASGRQLPLSSSTGVLPVGVPGTRATYFCAVREHVHHHCCLRFLLLLLLLFEVRRSEPPLPPLSPRSCRDVLRALRSSRNKAEIFSDLEF